MVKKAGLRRVVLDTNALVSALLFTGVSNELVGLWRTGAIELLASAAMIQEYLRVLGYPKFRLGPEEALALAREEVLPFIRPVAVASVAAVVAEDPADDQFLACAVAGKADALVSGDRHLLRLGSHRDVPILAVRAFLERAAPRRA